MIEISLIIGGNFNHDFEFAGLDSRYWKAAVTRAKLLLWIILREETMAMQTVYFKEHHEGNGHNQNGQLSSVHSSAPWWSSLGSQSVYGASCGQLKPLSMETSTEEAGQTLDKPNTTHFSFFPGN